MPNSLRLTLNPSKSIEYQKHRIERTQGAVRRYYREQTHPQVNPTEVISFIIASAADIPGDNNNMIAFAPQQQAFCETTQRVLFLNTDEHEFEVEQIGEVISSNSPAWQTNGAFWDTDYPDSRYPNNFIARGLERHEVY